MTHLPKRAILAGIKIPKGHANPDILEWENEMDGYMKANGPRKDHVSRASILGRSLQTKLPRSVRPKTMLRVSAGLAAAAVSRNIGPASRAVAGLASVGIASLAIDRLVMEETEVDLGVRFMEGEPSNEPIVNSDELITCSFGLAGLSLVGEAAGLSKAGRAAAAAGAVASLAYSVLVAGAETGERLKADLAQARQSQEDEV